MTTTTNEVLTRIPGPIRARMEVVQTVLVQKYDWHEAGEQAGSFSYWVKWLDRYSLDSAYAVLVDWIDQTITFSAVDTCGDLLLYTSTTCTTPAELLAFLGY